jgi:hypothetical protein
MAEVTIDIDVECQECGEGLDVLVPYAGTFQIVPCTKCLAEARQVGYDEGLSDGEYD